MAKNKQPTEKQIKATEKAYKLRQLSANDDVLSKRLNLSKVTFYTRLTSSNWKDTEILFIEYLYDPALFIQIQALEII